MSDIFGTMVDEYTSGTINWCIGEDLLIQGGGCGFRDMSDPASFGHFDWYPTRYTGSADYGGVHWNSGIANLAFYLLSIGGSHPRGKSNVVVPAIGQRNAANIFYQANTACLTTNSNFEAARLCTAMKAESIFGSQSDEVTAVHLAWDAVGVPGSPVVSGPTPAPTAAPTPAPLPSLQDGITVTGLAGNTGDVKHFQMAITLSGLSQRRMTCTTSGSNGDADLYIRFGAEAIPNWNDSNNACASYSSSSNEQCTTPFVTQGTMGYVAVSDAESYSLPTLQFLFVVAILTFSDTLLHVGPLLGSFL
jgi:vibriolysin